MKEKGIGKEREIEKEAKRVVRERRSQKTMLEEKKQRGTRSKGKRRGDNVEYLPTLFQEALLDGMSCACSVCDIDFAKDEDA